MVWIESSDIAFHTFKRVDTCEKLFTGCSSAKHFGGHRDLHLEADLYIQNGSELVVLGIMVNLV